MVYITEDEVGRLLSMDEAIRAVDDAFRHLGTGSAVNIPRSRVRLPDIRSTSCRVEFRS